MKICTVAYTFYENDNRVRRYAEALAARGDEVDCFALRRGNQPRFEIIRGVHLFRVQQRERNETTALNYLLKLLAFLVRAVWYLTIHHIRRRYDVIHVHSVPDFLVFATIVPRLLGAKVILDIHDIVPELYASKFAVSDESAVFRLLLLVERVSARYADHVIIANHLWYDKLTARCVPTSKCTAIINYPDPLIFYPRPASNVERSRDFIMCYPGSLNHHQGVDLAITAVALLREKVPDLRFHIIGDGPDRDKLRSIIHDLTLSDRISLSGMVPMEQIASFLANVDLGVVPKRNDSFGNEAFSTKILEFMAMGVPVLTANTQIDRYYFDDALVEFFESGDANDLACHILKLKQDQHRRQILRQHGLEFAQINSWHLKRVQYFELLDRINAKKKGQSATSSLV